MIFHADNAMNNPIDILPILLRYHNARFPENLSQMSKITRQTYPLQNQILKKQLIRILYVSTWVTLILIALMNLFVIC